MRPADERPPLWAMAAPLAAMAAMATMVAALPSCGLKTSPRPVEATAPVIESAPRLEVGANGGVTVTWRRPERSRDGTRLYDLAAFSVERDSGAGFSEVARIAVDDNERIRPQQNFGTTDGSAPPGTSSYRLRALLTDGQWGRPGPARAVTVPSR